LGFFIWEVGGRFEASGGLAGFQMKHVFKIDASVELAVQGDQSSPDCATA
jgi:hypothetical protein